MRHARFNRALSAILATVMILPMSGCAARRRPGGGESIGAIRVSGSEAWLNGEPARNGWEIYSGDKVRTGASTSVIVDFVDGGRIQLDQNTDPDLWTWIEMNVCIIKIFVGYGRIAGETAPSQHCRWQVTTDSLRSIAHTSFHLEVEPQHAILTVIEGEMLIEAPEPRSVTTAQQAEIAGPRLVGVRPLAPPELREIMDWTTRYQFPPPRPPGPSWTKIAIIGAAAAAVAGIVAGTIAATRKDGDHRDRDRNRDQRRPEPRSETPDQRKPPPPPRDPG